MQMDDEEEAARAIDDMVEAIAQQITATPIEDRKAAMEAIGQGLLAMFDEAEANSGTSPENNAPLLAALNERISVRVIELDGALDLSGKIRRS